MGRAIMGDGEGTADYGYANPMEGQKNKSVGVVNCSTLVQLQPLTSRELALIAACSQTYHTVQ